MKRERLARIRGTSESGPGSGYVVAPRLVLTSAHLVGQLDAAVQVIRPGYEGDQPGREAQFVGRVVWRGTPGGRDDAALVAIDDPKWSPVDGAPTRWGRTVTYQTGRKCKFWGTPDAIQALDDRARETMQLRGAFHPGTGMVNDRYVIHVEDFPLAPGPIDSSPWGGMSGAAVFCDDLLVGVIARDPTQFGHSALGAVPVYVLHHDAEFRAALAAYNATTVIEAVELTKLTDPEHDPRWQSALGSPAQLLTARRAVVEFRSRAELLGQLRTWSRQPGAGVCLVHGTAGQGKTRLASHFGDEFAQDPAGGIVLWLSRDAADLTMITETVEPVLVIVDYAETRRSQLERLLKALATRNRSARVKVLALARTAGEWWSQLKRTSDAVTDLMLTAIVTELQVLDITDTDRRDSYRAAVAEFAGELARMPEHASTDWSARAAALVDRPLPSTTTASTVLAIQMTALADLLDVAGEPSGSEGNRLAAAENSLGSEHGGSPEQRVIDHEIRYWENTAEAIGIYPNRLGPSTLSDAVAATVLLPPPPPELANDWLARIPGLSDSGLDLRRSVREWLAGLYPAIGPYAFGQLEPDRLGEYLIGDLVARQGRGSIAETLAAHVDGEDAARWVSVCARATAHPGLGDRVDELLARMFEKHPATVAVAALNVAPGLEAPGPLVHAMECLVRNPSTPIADLARIDMTLTQPSLLWADIAAELSAVLAARCQPEEPDGQGHAPQDQADLSRMINEVHWLIQGALESEGLSLGDVARTDRAWHLFNLAARLEHVGRRAEALTTSTEAVEMFRRLARGSESREPHPQGKNADHLAGLAKSLANHSNYLMHVGRRDDALAAITEAVQIFSQLVEEDRDSFLPDLAGSLSNYSAQLADASRQRESLAASDKAVRIYRGLVTADRDDLLYNFVMSLGNHFNQLTDPGRRAEVLAETTEAVQILRHQAQARPDALLPNFAKCLNCLSNQLAALGRREMILEVATEVVQIHRQLAEAHPDAFRPDLAGYLHNLAMALAELKRWRDRRGLDAITEAVNIRRELTGLSEITEDVIRRELHEARQASFLPDFARSLNDRAVWLTILGRREEAQKSITEAITIRQQLAATHPSLYQRELDKSLHVLSMLGDASPGLERDALRYGYLAADPHDIAIGYHNLGNYVRRHARQPLTAIACHLAAALIYTLTGIGDNAGSVREAANDLRELGATGIVANIAALTRCLEFPDTDPTDLISRLSPDPETAERILQDLIAQAREIAGLPENLSE